MRFLTKDRSFYRSLFLLALPIALQNLVTFSVGLADNVMIGALGDTAVSAVYMSGQIQTLLQVFSGGIEGAILILSAQYWGKGDTDSIRRIVSIGLKVSVLFGAILNAVCALFPSFIVGLFTTEPAIIASGAAYLRIVAFSYVFFCLTQALIAAMRSVETAKIGLYVSLVSLILNIALNYVLIFGKFGAPALGVEGAALATLISRVAETAVIALYVFLADKKLRFSPGDVWHTDRRLLRDFLKYGLPIIGGQMVWASNMLIGSAILGRFDETVIAAVSVTGTMNNLCYVVMNGMAGAVGIITGKTVGEGKTERMKEYAVTVQWIFLFVGLATSGVLQLVRSPFLALYRISTDATAYANQFLNVLSVTFIGTSYQCASLFGLVKSGGDISFVFKNDAIFIFLIVLPAGFLCQHFGLPAWVVFAALKSDQILKCVVAFFKIRRFDWMKNLTSPDTATRV